MTPVERAAAVYDREPCARTFREDLEAHLLHGFVFSTPSYFIMGRPVDGNSTQKLICNPWVSFPSPDCWHVYLYSGHLSDAFANIPYILPFVSFERNNILTKHPLANIQRKCAALSLHLKKH